MDAERRRIVRYTTYITVWAVLMALTGLTVFASRVVAGTTGILTAVAIASIKAGLVLSFFMHLRYERPLLRFLFFVPVATLAVIIGFTFIDVWYR